MEPSSSIESYTRPLLDRVGFAARNTNTSTTAVLNNLDIEQSALTELDLMTIYALPGLQSVDALRVQKDRLEPLVNQINTLQPQIDTIPPDTALTTEQQTLVGRTIGVSRNASIVSAETTAMTYAGGADELLRQLQLGYRTKAYYTSPRLLITRVSQDTQADTSTFSFDIRKNDIRAIPMPGQAQNVAFLFEVNRGLLESEMEGEILSLVQNQPATAAINIFSQLPDEANLLFVDEDTLYLLDGTDLSIEAKARISAAVADNKIVVVPDRLVNLEGVDTVNWLEVAANGHTIAVSENGEHQALISYPTLIQNSIRIGGAIVGFAAGFSRGTFTFLAEFLNNINQSQPFEVAAKKAKQKMLDDAIAMALRLGLGKAKKLAGWQKEILKCLTRTKFWSNNNATIDVAGSCITGFIRSKILNGLLPGLSSQISTGILGGLATATAWVQYNLPVDPVIFPFLSTPLEPTAPPITPSTTPNISLQLVPDTDIFTVPAGDALLPSHYVANIQNLGPNSEVIDIDFTNIPSGYVLQSSIPQITIPPGQTGKVGICLRPQDDECPAANASRNLDFSAQATGSSGASSTATTSFTLPDLVNINLSFDPASHTTATNTSVAANLNITSVCSNVPANNIPIDLSQDPSLAVSGVPSSVSLDIDETKQFPVTLTPANGTENQILNAAVTATFGQDLDGNPYEASAIIDLTVRSAEIIPIQQCAQTAASVDNAQLTQNLSGLAEITAQLQQNPNDSALCARATLLYDQLLQLADVNPGLTAQKPVILALRDLAAACNASQLVTDSSQFFADNCAIQTVSAVSTISLSPSSLSLEPNQSGELTLRLENKDNESRTFNLTLDTLPTSANATLSRTQVTLAAGEVLDANSANPVTIAKKL